MIHQMYCTHCTHGSSALQRQQGELADRVLGYSARGGSLEAGPLRRCYRQIEPYIYYYLPRDTPTEEKLRRDASSAPRRLVYLPSAGGLQWVAQVCYRPTDTQGRPGSYFAHVLFRPQREGQRGLSSLECLKLWEAPGWVEEDSPDLPFLLAPLRSLDQMLGRRRPALDDDVLLGFLQSPPGSPLDDPAGMIPARWRQKPAAERIALVRDALGGFLQLDRSRGESLLLVVEPPVAALVFYAIVRLLPEGSLRDRISFSTFEPNPDRLCTTLAATKFHDCRATDLPLEVYRSGGFVLNTFLGHRSKPRPGESPYAEVILGRLLEKGWAAVDHTLEAMRAAGARRTDDLQRLAAVDRVVPVLLQTGQSPGSQPWRSSPVAEGYLQQALGCALGELSGPEAQLEGLIGRPAQLTILELAAGRTAVPGTEAAVQLLLRRLPEEWIAELLKLEGVAPRRKADVLARYVAAHGDLPPGCEGLWSEAARPPKARSRTDDELLLPQVVARLDRKTLEQLYTKVASRHGPQLFAALRESCSRKGSVRTPLTRLVESMEDEALVSLLGSMGPGFLKDYPADEPALGRKLQAMLRTLPEHPGQFPARLDAILAGEHLLPEPADRRAAAAWGTCRQAILEIGNHQDQKSGVLRRAGTDRLEDACRSMSEAAAAAMPTERFPDDRRGTRKQEVLRKIGPRVLGGRKLLPPGPWERAALWQKVLWHFETGTWPSVPLAKMRRRSASSARTWGIVGAVVALGLFAVVLGFWVLPKIWQREAPPTDVPAKTISEDNLTTPVAAAGPAGNKAQQHPAAMQQSSAAKAAPQKTTVEPGDAATEAARQRREEEATRREQEATRLAEQEAARVAAVEKAAAERAAARREKKPPSPSPPTAPAVPTVKPRPPVKPIPPAKPDAAGPAPAASLTIVGHYNVEQAPARALGPTAMARIRPLVLRSTGRLVPGWFKNTYVVGCRIKGHGEGGNVRLLHLHNLNDQPAGELPDGTSKAEVQFCFFLPSGDLLGTPREAAVTDWHTIAPIARGQQYTVKLGLTREQLESLRKLAKR